MSLSATYLNVVALIKSLEMTVELVLKSYISLKTGKPQKIVQYFHGWCCVKANDPHRTRMWTLRWTRSSYCAFPLWHQCHTKKRGAFQLTSFWTDK